MAADEMRKFYLFALKALSDIFATILIPAVLALVLRYLFNLSPLTFFLLLGVAFVLTSVVLVRKIKSYGRAFQQLSTPQDESRGTGGGTAV